MHVYDELQVGQLHATWHLKSHWISKSATRPPDPNYAASLQLRGASGNMPMGYGKP